MRLFAERALFPANFDTRDVVGIMAESDVLLAKIASSPIEAFAIASSSSCFSSELVRLAASVRSPCIRVKSILLDSLLAPLNA